MKECRKCGNLIPSKIKVDGVQKNLQNRKFCLDCSPWGNHNTSPDDPSPDDPINRKERKYFKYTDKQKDAIKLSLYKRGLERKTKLIEMSGGACQCGYNKNKRALEFHHRDPNSKKFGLCLNNLWSKSWKDIESEWVKCILVCSNCHAEIEDELSRKTSIVAKVNEKYGTNY